MPDFVYAIVTALVAFFLMPPDDPAYVPQVIGIMTNAMLHKIAPIMAVIDFVLFDPAPAFPLALHVLVAGVLPCILGLRAAIWAEGVRDRRPAAVRIRTTSSTSTHSRLGKDSALAAASWP